MPPSLRYVPKSQLQAGPVEPSQAQDGLVGQLGPAERRSALAAVDNPEAVVDLVVVGGGVTGAGCALDAAARGLSVVLLERSDIAAGTSSRSSKLIHGGLRYLAQWRFGLVREALGERTLIASKLAPHLVHPVAFMYLLERTRTRLGGWIKRGYVGAGVLLYDLLARLRGGRALLSGPSQAQAGLVLPFHKHLSAKATQRLATGLNSNSHNGAVLFWDAQTDDARHTLALARTAAAYGALILTSVEVTGAITDAADTPVTVLATDRETGQQLQIRSQAIINATGVWSDDVDALANTAALASTAALANTAALASTTAKADTAAPANRVRVSKGVHLVLARESIDSDRGMIFPTSSSVLFVIPWPAGSKTWTHWIVGTTDTDWQLDRTHPAANRGDIRYLLGEVNKVLARPLSEAEVLGVYVGLRPLLAGEDSDTSKLSREHAVTQVAPRMVSVKGGKYTTYRVMAADAVDAATKAAGIAAPASNTANVKLVGAGNWNQLRHRSDELASEFQVSLETVMRLLNRHGDQTPEVLELTKSDATLGRPLATGLSYLRAEVVHAVRCEAALHLDDVLTRRTRLSVETPERALEVAEDAAALMAAELGWTQLQTQAEVRCYLDRVAAERDSQTKDADLAASAARLVAADARQSGPFS